MSVSWRVVVLVDWMGSLIRVGSAFHGKWSVCNSLWRLATNTNAMTYCIPSRNQNCLQESLNYLPTTIVAPTNFESHTCNAGLYCALSLSLSLFYILLLLSFLNSPFTQCSMSNLVHVQLVFASSKDSEKLTAKSMSLHDSTGRPSTRSHWKRRCRIPQTKKNVWISQKDGLLLVGKEALIFCGMTIL